MHSDMASILRVQEAPADTQSQAARRWKDQVQNRGGQLSGLFEELSPNTSLMNSCLCLTTVITMGARKYGFLARYIVTPRV